MYKMTIFFFLSIYLKPDITINYYYQNYWIDKIELKL